MNPQGAPDKSTLAAVPPRLKAIGASAEYGRLWGRRLRGINAGPARPGRRQTIREALTTVAAAFPRLAPRGDRSQGGLELGVEPPIRIGDDRFDRNDRRRASLRWLGGAALTGLSGVALIGAALFFDLDSQYNFAEAPEFTTAAAPSDSQEEGVNPGKGDRLLRPVDIVSDKQTYKVPTTLKIGDKEVVKARSFTRLQTTLTMTPTGFADAVPPFNPLKLTNRADVADAAPDPGPAQDDAEVTFSTRDLRPADAEQASGELSQAEAQAQVVETLKAPPDAPKASGQALAPQLLLMRTSQAAGDPLGALSSYATVGNVSPGAPFASIEVRMIPENVTNVAKAAAPDDASPNEKLGADAARRKLRGRAEGQRSGPRGGLRHPGGIRREARRIAGRGRTENHHSPRGAGRTRREAEDRPRLGLRRRSIEGDGGDQRQRRLCAGVEQGRLRIAQGQRSRFRANRAG